MIVKLLVTFFLCSAFVASSQSKYGFETGIDTTALNHRVKIKTEYQVTVYPDSIDTLYYKKFNYDSIGYITRYEFQNLKNHQPKSVSPLFPNKYNSVDFEYTNGYLSNERYYMSGPQANGSFGKDTTRKKVETTWELFDNTERIKEEHITYIYDGGHISMSEKKYGYLPNGLIDFMETKYVHTSYIYSKDGLLIERKLINEYGVFEQHFISYEFYEE